MYINYKSIVWNNIDHFGQEKLFGKFTCAQTVRALSMDRPRHQGVPQIGTLQNTCLHCILSEGEERNIQDQARTVRPLKNQKNPKVTGSVKCIFNIPVDHPGWTAGCFIWLLTTHLMHYSHWYSCYCWTLRFQSLMCRGWPSAVGRKVATTRKWLVAINTTPTTSIQ
jgi:hypothetical protein